VTTQGRECHDHYIQKPSAVMRALIVADHPLAAEAIRRELRHAAAFHAVGVADGRHPCTEAVATAAPHVVVIDQMADQARTLARLREARTAAPAAKVVLLTTLLQDEPLAEATAAGAHAAISRSLRPGAVGVFVREVARGNVFHAFTPPETPADVGSAGLTPREHEILRLMATGASNAAIASKLWVTEQTVKFHLSNVYRKLSVANRTQASHYARTHGLLFEPPAPAGPVPLSTDSVAA
jgi:DNA-binding NarL/FixJ family response regulator